MSAPGSGALPHRAILLPVSLVLHAATLLVLFVVPLLFVEPLPPAASATKAFFVAPAAATPPPPPPPPARSIAPRTVPTPRAPESSTFVVRVDQTAQVTPEEGLDLGVAGGDAGGVEGGVPGGVVGGVVGGLPEAPREPPPMRVGGAIPEPKKVKHVDPVYPALLRKARVGGIVILECTISPAGKVAAVRVLRGIPMLDDAAMEAVRQWVYTPTLLDGVPISVIMTVTLNFSVKAAAATGN